MTDHLGEELVLLNAVTNAQRALLGLRRREEATDVMVELVRSLGGTVIAAHLRSEDALQIDLTFGERETLLPAARPGTPARARLERLLPSLVEQARGIVGLLDHVGRLDRVDVTDLLTGLSTRSELTHVMERAGEGDRLVGFAIDRFDETVEVYGRPRVDALVRQMGQLAGEHSHAADHAARVGPGAVAVLATRPRPQATERLVRQVLDRWSETRLIDVELITCDVAVADPVTALTALDRKLELVDANERTLS